LQAVLYIDVSEQELIRRLSGRLVCREQGHIYHKHYNPPEEPGVCDIDGSELYQREDDKEETVRHRIEVFLEQTEPLVEHYRSQGLLKEVDGNQPVEEVKEALLAAVQQEA
jgi:adenylate kinase